MLSRLMTIREQAVLAGLAVAMVAGAGVLLYVRPPAPSAGLEISKGTPTEAPTLKPATPVLPPPAPELPSKAISVAAPKAEEVPLAQPLQGPSVTIHDETAISLIKNNPFSTNTRYGVSVQGEVKTPGFYWLTEDSRVNELIEAAGGLTAEADVSDLNLSARLVDATTLIVPRSSNRIMEGSTLRAKGGAPAENLAAYTISGQGLASPQAAAPASHEKPATFAAPQASLKPAAAGGKIDLNTATPEELDTLPGIGAAFAERIIAGRPYASVEDLDSVSGIGPKRLATLRELVTVSNAAQ